LLFASRASASVISISQGDNGRAFTFDRGDALEISLPATSGTGYTWQAEPNRWRDHQADRRTDVHG
jgi:hypothetical protein